MNRPRKVHVKSFGCQMNVYDSHRMADTLAPEGYVETLTPADADLVILNTCHIREKAVDKVYSEIGRMRELKDAAELEGRQMLIAVAGCVAQAEGKEIIRRTDSVDLVVGLAELSPPARLLARARDGEKIVDTEFPLEDKFDALAQPSEQAIRRARHFRLSSPCRKAATSSAPSASCPTRAAPRFRAPSPRSSPMLRNWRPMACAKSL